MELSVYKFCNVAGEVLDGLIYLNIILPSCCRPDPVVVFLQPAQQTHPRCGVGPTPVLAHAFLPPIPQGLIPVSAKALGNLLQMMVAQRVDILSPLFQSELGWRFTMRMVNAMHQLPDHRAEAVHKPLILAFQFCKSLLVLHRQIDMMISPMKIWLYGSSSICLKPMTYTA